MGRATKTSSCLLRTGRLHACLPVGGLSGVLNSETAIRVHIQIIRVFAKMKEMLLTHKDILLQLEKMEKKLSGHDEDIRLIFQYLKQLLNPPQSPRRKIGFRGKNEMD